MLDDSGLTRQDLGLGQIRDLLGILDLTVQVSLELVAMFGMRLCVLSMFLSLYWLLMVYVPSRSLF